jgi:hypothetical protein
MLIWILLIFGIAIILIIIYILIKTYYPFVFVNRTSFEIYTPSEKQLLHEKTIKNKKIKTNRGKLIYRTEFLPWFQSQDFRMFENTFLALAQKGKQINYIERRYTDISYVFQFKHNVSPNIGLHISTKDGYVIILWAIKTRFTKSKRYIDLKRVTEIIKKKSSKDIVHPKILDLSFMPFLDVHKWYYFILTDCNCQIKEDCK